VAARLLGRMSGASVLKKKKFSNLHVSCATSTAPTLATCVKTQGPFGEMTNPFTTHDGIGAKAAIIDYPVDPDTVKILWLSGKVRESK